MKTLIGVLILGLVIPFFGRADDDEFEVQTKEPEEVSLGLTHLLPSTNVIPADTLLLGSTIGTGFLGRFDATSNLYLDLQQVFNITGKMRLFGTDSFAAALTLSYITQSTRTQAAGIGNTANSENINDISPGGVLSYRINKKLTGHFGGSYHIRSPDIKRESLYRKSAFLQGFTLNKEFGFLVAGLTFVAGASYDIVYQILGAGASVHLSGFQIGAHIYPNVSEGQVLPIVSGGFTTDF